MNKLKFETPDMVEKNIEKLAEIFPNCITEARDENGKLKKAVNFEMLQQILSTEFPPEGSPERYEFTWVGKRTAIAEANKPIRKTLRPCKTESKNWDTTENLYIEGDNLEVLKLLQESYLGKVKMIYIDPPYNTGNDFIYRDDFKQTQQEYDEQVGLFDEDDNCLFKNTETNGRFHSDWCSMMYSRLMLAKNFLSDDGVICVQINDNEYDNLKKLLNEIFGESNYLNTVAVKMAEPTGMKMAHANRRLPKLKEYILIYKKKDISNLKVDFVPKEDWDNEYKTFLDGVTEADVDFIKAQRDKSYKTENDIIEVDKILKKIKYIPLKEAYDLYKINDKKRLEFNYNNSWRIVQTVSMTGGAKLIADKKRKLITQQTFSILTPEGKMYFIKGDYDLNIEKPRIKLLFADDYLVYNPGDFWQDIKTTGLDNEGFVSFRNGKKPIKLIIRLLKIFTDDNDIIMDFFAGSATTAHAILKLNNEKNEKRKFILVQLPENIDKQLSLVDSETKKDFNRIIKFLDSKNLPHLLSEIGKERIRLVGNEVNMYIDSGFRVFKVDSSNMNDVYYSASEYSQDMLVNLEDNIKPDRTDLDLLFGCLLDWGLPISLPYTSEQIENCTVHTYNEGDLVACFDENIPESVIKEIAKRKPLRAVFRDAGFGSSPEKINVTEIFKMLAPDTDVKVI